jgi:hypothetical protein
MIILTREKRDWQCEILKKYCAKAELASGLRRGSVHGSYAANEGPERIQYKCLVPIYVFPEMKLLFQNRIKIFCLVVPSLIYLREIYIFPESVWLFCCSEIYGPILEKEHINGIFLAVYCIV